MRFIPFPLLWAMVIFVIALLPFSHLDAQQQPPIDNLVFHFPFDGSASDASRNHHDGIVHEATLVADRFGNPASAYDFNGRDAWIELPPATYFSGDFTLSAWVKPHSFTRWCRVVDFGNGRDAQNVFLALSGPVTGIPAGAVFGPQGRIYTQVNGHTPLALNLWNHLILLAKGDNLYLYVNRELIAVQPRSQKAPAVTRTSNFIGKGNWAQDALTDAAIDDLRLYGRALNETEIASLFYEGDQGEIIFSEDFEDDRLHDWMSHTQTGTFTQSPAIKNIHTLDQGGQSAFEKGCNGEISWGFGLSTCMANCRDQFTSTLTVEFPEEREVTTITFREMEWMSNFGSRGTVLIDGQPTGFEFSKRPHTYRPADTTCRVHALFIGKPIRRIDFVVTDIAGQGELLLDDIIVRGTPLEEEPLPDGFLVYVGDLGYPCAENSIEGRIRLKIKGGTSPYTIRWAIGKRSLVIDHLSAGDYFVKVTDAQGEVRRLWIPLPDVCEDNPVPDTCYPVAVEPVPEELPAPPASSAKKKRSPADYCNHHIIGDNFVGCGYPHRFHVFYLKPCDPDWDWSWELPEGLEYVKGTPHVWHNVQIWVTANPGFRGGTIRLTGRLPGGWDGKLTQDPSDEVWVCHAEKRVSAWTTPLCQPTGIRGKTTITAGIVTDFSVEACPEHFYLWELDPPEFGELYYDGAPGAIDTILVLASGRVNEATLSVSAETACNGSEPVSVKLTLDTPPSDTIDPLFQCSKVDPLTATGRNGTIHVVAASLPEGSYTLRIADQEQRTDSCTITLMAAPAEAPQSDGVAKLFLEKEVFTPGERITVDYKVSMLLIQNDAWMALVPSETMHGTSSVNNQHKIGWQSLRNQSKGTLVFNAPRKEGRYDFRLNTSFNNGFELGSISFEVRSLQNRCTQRFFTCHTTPRMPDSPEASNGLITGNFTNLMCGTYTLTLYDQSSLMRQCTHILEIPDSLMKPPYISTPPTPPPPSPDPSVIPPSDSTLTIVYDSIFPETGCPKRISRMIRIEPDTAQWRQFLTTLDNLGKTGWLVYPEVTLFGYMTLSHDTLSRPPRNERYAYKSFRCNWDEIADSANQYGKDGWELRFLSLLGHVMTKNLTPGTSPGKFEYLSLNDLPDAFSSASRYEKNGKTIVNLLNEKGREGWDVMMIGGSGCLLGRNISQPGKQVEYGLMPLDDVQDIPEYFREAGLAGWEFCSWPVVFYKAQTPPPMLMKRVIGTAARYEYKYKLIDQMGLWGKHWEQSVAQMQQAINEATAKGWTYGGLMVTDEGFCRYNDKFLIIFKTNLECK